MSDQSNSAAAALPRFNVAPYKPDNGFAGGGVLMLISALVLVGAVMGFVAHWISQYFYLIILFPCGIGLVLGAVGSRMVHQGRIRNPLIGGLAGFLGGVMAMTMMHYFDYDSFRKGMAQLPPEARQELKEMAAMSAEQRSQAIRKDLKADELEELNLLMEAAQVNSFWSYMEMEARQGVELKKSGRSGRGINLGYNGSYIYWLIEMLIVAGITYAMVRSRTLEPFCTACDTWKRPKVLGGLAADPQAASAAVASGDLARVAAAQPTQEIGALRLTAACCDGCVGQGTVDVKLDHMTTDGKGNVQTKTLVHSTYPAQALPPLLALWAPQPAVAPPATDQAPSV